MRVAWSVVMAVLCACSDPGGPSGPAITSRAERKEIPLYTNRQLDLLFVIDTSPAMTPHLARVAANVPRYMHMLETIEGGLPDVHIGVVTSDLGGSAAGCTATGQDGALQTTAGVTGAFISDRRTIDGTRENNYTGALADVFTQLATRGDQGCAVQQPLEAAKRALSNHPANAGFLRDDAFLLVVFISATDEPSTAVEPFAQALKSLKPDPAKVMVSAVIAPSDPVDATCAAPPARHLHAFLTQFPGRAHEASICAENHEDALAHFAGLPTRILGNPCWDGVLTDVDPEAAGLQPGCAAWVEAETFEVTVPGCDTGLTPCYEIQEEPTICTFGSHRSVRLLPRFAYSSEPARLIIECLVE